MDVLSKVREDLVNGRAAYDSKFETQMRLISEDADSIKLEPFNDKQIEKSVREMITAMKAPT